MNEHRDFPTGNQKGWFKKIIPSFPAEHQQANHSIFAGQGLTSYSPPPRACSATWLCRSLGTPRMSLARCAVFHEPTPDQLPPETAHPSFPRPAEVRLVHRRRRRHEAKARQGEGPDGQHGRPQRNHAVAEESRRTAANQQSQLSHFPNSITTGQPETYGHGSKPRTPSEHPNPH